LSRRGLLFSLAAVTTTLAAAWSFASATPSQHRTSGRERLGAEASGPPKGFVPAVLRDQRQLGRYFVVMRQPAVAQRVQARGTLSARSERATATRALHSQHSAISQARAAGGQVIFRYKDLVNGFSANLSPAAAATMANRSDVASVQPVSIVRKLPATRAAASNGAGQSVSFIGAPKVWNKYGARGQGITVADVDTGIDYTHKNFGGSGNPAAYASNDPNFIEPGTFPTKKVIGGYDFVGSNYDVLDDDTSNDIPRPDADPLDRDGHGSHTAGSCCGDGVPGKVGKGVAPQAKLYAIKVWDVGNSTADVLVAGYERAMDPNEDGNLKDAADVLTFSGGVDYGTLNSVEARAAQRVVNLGTVFVAAAGNAGNQPSGASAYITGTPANARGVISVAASVSQFRASHLVVNSPSIDLPQGGLMIHQDWSAALPTGGLTSDLVDGRELDPANPVPSDAMFCGSLPAGSLTGDVVVVYKGDTGAGDCAGSDKVGNAEAAGAVGVILVSIFPSGQATSLAGDPRGIPTVMVGRGDGDAILDALSPNAPASYNDATVNATLDPNTVVFPQFQDSMTDFSSEGPARLTSDLKPDISAPGFDILSTAVGTGDQGIRFSGTSMATPHVAGVAALLRQLHPHWSVPQIKAVLMNQATRQLKNSDLSKPVPATVMGSGRVQADRSAQAVSLAQPGSLSFGFHQVAGTTSSVRSFTVHNLDAKIHRYTVGGSVRYADFDPSVADIAVAKGQGPFGAQRSFQLGPHQSQRVHVRLRLDPSAITEADQLDGDYYFNPGVDGTVTVLQTLNGSDTLKVAWGVSPLAASKDALSKSSLDLSGGPATMTMTRGAAAGTDYADLYQLGATDPVNSTGEEDITAIGARSFTGPNVGNEIARGVPTGTDALAGSTWQQFLTDVDSPDEPVEFGVQTAAVHNTTETLEVDVLVDDGADGVFSGADEGIDADYLIVKQPAPFGEVCVYDLSQPNALDSCAATYFPDYTNYNGNLVGLVVDAGAIGLSNAVPRLSYQVKACTGDFSGDVPAQICDTAGGFDDATGTYTSRLNVSHPGLHIDPLVCRGFWDGGACNGGDPIRVNRDSAPPSKDPSILALFPNNVPAREPTVVTTSH
jgi:subtilisin family serine protease